MELAAREDEQHGGAEHAEEVEKSGARGDVLQERVPQDIAVPLAQLFAHVRRRGIAHRRVLALADREDEERGADEAQGVECERGGRSQEVYHDARDTRAAYLRRGAADLQLRVAV